MNKQVEKDWVDLVLHANIGTPTMKLVMLAIAQLANENGRCRPSITRLAILTGLDRRTVTRNLKKLEEDYWLSIVRPGTPRSNETNFYMLSARRCRINKVQFGLSSKTYRVDKVGAQNPQSRGTASPNINTPAPRPTAAPQAQAGGSGAGINVRENIETDTTSHCWDFLDDDPEAFESRSESSGPDVDTTQTEVTENPFEGRQHITQAEWDWGIENGIGLFDLPEVRAEPE